MIIELLLASSLSFTEVDPSDNYGSHHAGVFSDGDSWATFESVEDRTNELEKVPGAATRAAFRAPVVEVCGEISSANGARRVEKREYIYFPLTKGSYSKSSGYGWRIHPIYGYPKIHEGTDYSAAYGTPIFSIAEGIVVESEYGSSSGYHVKIQHKLEDGSVWYSDYLHQPSLEVGVGDRVAAGQRIGSVGSTGASTGAHLHLEILDKNGDHLDPVPWLDERKAIFVGEGCILK